MKNYINQQRGKMRRAAKKAATKTGKFGQMDAQTNVQLPEISVSATPASSSLSMPQLMEELSAPCGIPVRDVVGTVSHDVEIVHVNNSNNNSINDTNDRTIAYADDGNDVTHPPNESDSDSDKDENDEDDNIHNENISCTNNLHHTIAAAVPVEDEMDRNDLINNLRRNDGADSSDNSIKERSTGRGNDYHPISLSIQSPLSLSESLTKLDYKEENDSNNAQTSNPLSRKRNRSAKDK